MSSENERDVRCWRTRLGWLYYVLLAENTPCQILLCCLHYTLPVSPSLFMFPVLSFKFCLNNSPPLLSLSLSDKSLRSFTSKDAFVPLFCLQRCGLRQTGAWKRTAVAPCLWFTEWWGWSKRQRFGVATSGDVAGCIRLSKVRAGSHKHWTWLDLRRGIIDIQLKGHLEIVLCVFVSCCGKD